MNYAAIAWSTMVYTACKESGRGHYGVNLPDGGRLYFEYRGGRNHE